MKFFLNLFFLSNCLYFNYSVTAQPNKIHSKAEQLFNNGISKTQELDYKEAINLFRQATEKDTNFVAAFLSLAGVYGQIKEHNQATHFYETAFLKDSATTKLYQLPYAISLAGKGEFEKALQAVNNYLANPNLGINSRKAGDYRKKCFEFAVEFQKKNVLAKYVFAPKNLGDSINSTESEYFPSLTIDGKELVFTRRLNNTNEDFFSSHLINNERTNAVPLAGNVNTFLNEGAQNISQDGQWLVFTGCDRKDGWGGCDIYISFFTKDGWSEAINLGDKINSDQWDSQPCLSPDKKDLYFASRRWGGYGGSDIYVSHLLQNGNWSSPENLGAEINTSGDESSPFIHADNQTLYFTSNGLVCYGESDLFVSRKGPGSSWSVPENLGFPINTIHEEGTLFIAADAKTAFYSSNKSDSRGGLDIYSFELPKYIQPHKTLWVKGLVFDKKTNKGIQASVELMDINTNRLISKTQTDETGNYLVTLPIGKNYLFNVNRKGYLFYSDNFLLKQNEIDTMFEKNISLQPIEKEVSIILKNIFFDFAKSDLNPESEIELEKLVQLLKENPTLKIQFSGHTDNIGKHAENLTLSENRATVVVNYLTQKGIATDRLKAIGLGDSQPISTNDSENGRSQNRRTEMKIVSL